MSTSATVVVVGRGTYDAVVRSSDPSVGDALDRIASLGFDWNGRENLTILQDGVDVPRSEVHDTPLADGANITVLVNKPRGN